MRYTKRRDGLMRVTINVPIHLTREELKFIAFSMDFDELENKSPKPRIASRKEVLHAVARGYNHDLEWENEARAAFEGKNA